MNCRNCNTDLSPESEFCYSCGGKVIRNRLTLKNLFEHISETFFNYDNKLLRTFIKLFTKPEDVIGTYIDGVRKKYVNPISYFGLALTVSGLYLLVLNKFFPESIDFSTFTTPGAEDLQKKNVSFVQEYQSIVMMLYVPLYAIMARVSFVGLNKFNYTELVVVFLYIQAQLSIFTGITGVIVAVFGVSQGVFSMVSIPLMIMYSAFCLKRLYQLNFLNIILRTLLFLVVLAIVFIIVTIAFVVIMYLNGDMEQMIEAQRAARGG
ncbi:DUF3667 domain-containing protein [Sabulilitoribacter multivorans]|uniref:DUF3667 domain-containing protein n=1 Tax=Flaviramulus multivorans TaxID=1304750 RepID=A0ABS9ILG7_9FLAO|nr:DUF3667 domain-containing protein [Flaviramulus multivorans]MCF7561441.1 DUF3667 domain-containing protein [Flaviramulus multivorans]